MNTAMKHLSTLIAAVVLSAGAVMPAAAQPAEPEAVDVLLADEFARAALTLLSLPQTSDNNYPQPLAVTLLDKAVALDPSNPQLWTFRRELAEQMGDPEAQEAAIVGYLATGVEDDKAQYDLLRIRLARHQTLDEQYRALNQLLESQGARRLADPLRSRLASYAASLAQELVDPQAQAKWVVEAARLDPANAEAAQMLLELVIERGGEPLRQGTALINVVRASPMDPWARLELAQLLAQEGAYDRAAQQFQIVDNWIGSSPIAVGDKVFRELMPTPAYSAWLMTLSATGNDPLVLQIVTALDEYYQAYADARAQAQEAGTDVSQVPELPGRLPIELELIRLAVLDGPSDTDAAAASLAQIQSLLTPEAEGDAEPTPSGRLALIAAVFGPDMDQARQLAEALPADAAEKPLALGWVAAREGEADVARTHLAPLAEEKPLAAAGLALVDADDDADRARQLQEVLHRDSGSLAALASGRYLTRDGRDAGPSRVGLALTDRMSKFPESLWLVDLDRTPWLDARLRIRPARFNHLEPITAEITLWNTTRFPIAIGDEQVIRPRAILNVSASIGGQPSPPRAPSVVDLGRKLTLGPGERLIIDTRIDYHQFGTLRALNPGRGILFDTRLIVNPVVGQAGSFIPAATGGVSTVRDCIVQGSPPNAEAIDGWIAALDSDNPRDRLSAEARLAELDRDQLPTIVTREMQTQLNEVMTQRLAQWDERHQAWAVLFMRNADEATSTYGGMAADFVQASDSELVWLAYLARQVNDPDSAMLGKAIQRQDLPRASAFAETYRRALREAVVAREQFEQEQAEYERQQRLQQEQQQQGGGLRP